MTILFLMMDDSFSQAQSPLVIGMVHSRQEDLQGYYAVAPSNDYQSLIWRRLVEDGGQLTIRNLLHAVFATGYAEQEDYIFDEDGRTLSANASAQRIVTDWLALLKRFSGFTYELLQRALLEQVNPPSHFAKRH